MARYYTTDEHRPDLPTTTRGRGGAWSWWRQIYQVCAFWYEAET